MLYKNTAHSRHKEQRSGVTSFKVGSAIKESGNYVCIPCGYKKFLQKGEVFPECFSCVKKVKYENDSFFKGLEMWELVDENKS